LTSVYELTLGRLVTILGVISKNPSNPRFDQYIFESISGLMRYPNSSFYKDIDIDSETPQTPQVHRDRLPCNATNIRASAVRSIHHHFTAGHRSYVLFPFPRSKSNHPFEQNMSLMSFK